MSQRREPQVSPQRAAPGRDGVRKGTVALLTCGALAMGFVAGAIWEHRMGQSAPAPGAPSAAVPTQAAPSGPTPDQRAQLLALEARVQRDANDVQAWVDLGNLHYDIGRPLESIRAYESALALKPGNPDVITDLGTMYRAAGQPQKAVELFREANRIDPNHFNSLYNLGVVLLHDLNDTPGAAKAWEAFLRVGPQGPQAERIRGILKGLKAQGRLP